jgi:hypothetical protein
LKHIPYGQQVGDELSVMTVTEVWLGGGHVIQSRDSHWPVTWGWDFGERGRVLGFLHTGMLKQFYHIFNVHSKNKVWCRIEVKIQM